MSDQDNTIGDDQHTNANASSPIEIADSALQNDNDEYGNEQQQELNNIIHQDANIQYQNDQEQSDAIEQLAPVINHSSLPDSNSSCQPTELGSSGDVNYTSNGDGDAMDWTSSGKQFEEYAIENASKSLENGEHLNNDSVEVLSNLKFDIPTDQIQNTTDSDNLKHEDNSISEDTLTANEEQINDIAEIVEQSQPDQDDAHDVQDSNSEEDNSEEDNPEDVNLEDDDSEDDNLDEKSPVGVGSEPEIIQIEENSASDDDKDNEMVELKNESDESDEFSEVSNSQTPAPEFSEDQPSHDSGPIHTDPNSLEQIEQDTTNVDDEDEESKMDTEPLVAETVQAYEQTETPEVEQPFSVNQTELNQNKNADSNDLHKDEIAEEQSQTETQSEEQSNIETETQKETQTNGPVENEEPTSVDQENINSANRSINNIKLPLFEVSRDEQTSEGDQDFESSRLIQIPPGSSLLSSKTNVLRDTTKPLEAPSIAAFFGIDESYVESFDDDILMKISARIDDFIDLRSTKETTEIEFEQYKSTTNSRLEKLKNKLKQVDNEKSKVNGKFSTLNDSNCSLLNENQTLKEKIENQVKDIQMLNMKIQELNSQKESNSYVSSQRDLRLEELQNEIDQITDSNKKLRSQLLEANNTIEQRNNDYLKSKFDLTKTSQEFEVSEQSNKWYESKLKSTLKELTEVREQRRTKVSALETELDSNKQQLLSLKLKVNSLSESNEKLKVDNYNKTKKLNEVKDQLINSQHNFSTEMNSKERLNQLLEKSNKDLKDRVTFLDQTIESIRKNVADEAASFKVELEDAEKNIAEKNARISHLEETVAELSGNITNIGMNETFSNMNDIPETPLSLRRFKDIDNSSLNSPSVKQALFGNGVPLSKVYSDFQILKKQLIHERHLKEKMQTQVDHFVEELGRKLPIIEATKERCSILEEELSEMSVILENSAKEKSQLSEKIRFLQKKIKEDEYFLKTVEQQRMDLTKQVSTLLVQITLRSENQDALTTEESKLISRLTESENYEDLPEFDTNRIINERLLLFRDVDELLKKNSELLLVSRQLGQQLEESENSKPDLESLESKALDEAREAILSLQQDLKLSETKLKSATATKDILQKMLGSKNGNADLSLEKPVSSNDYERISKTLENTETEFRAYKRETKESLSQLNSKLLEKSKENNDLSISLEKAKSSVELSEEKYKSSQITLKYFQNEAEQLKSQYSKLQSSISSLESSNKQLTDNYYSAREENSTLKVQLNHLTSEQKIFKSVEEALRNENNSLMQEKSKLSTMINQINTLDNERQKNFAETSARLQTLIDSLQKEVDNTKSKLSLREDEIKKILTSRATDASLYQTRLDSLNSELAAAREKISEKTNLIVSLEIQINSLKSKLQDSSSSSNTAFSTSVLNDSATPNIEIALHKNEIAKYKELYEVTDKELTELTNTFRKFETETQQQIDKLEKMNESVSQELATTKSEKTSLESQLETSNKTIKEDQFKISFMTNKISAFENVKSDLNSKVDLLRKEIDDVRKSKEHLESELAAKKIEFNKESELKISLEKENIEFGDKIKQLESTVDNLRGTLAVNEENYEAQRRLLEEEKTNNAMRINELEIQNKVLLNQLENKSNEILSNKEIQSSDSELNEILSFLKREKESTEAQLYLLKEEKIRISQKLSISEEQLNETKYQLSKAEDELRSLKQSIPEDNTKQQLYELELFKNNNKDLRSQTEESNIKIKKLEDDITNLNTQIDSLKVDLSKAQISADDSSKSLTTAKEEVEYWKTRANSIIDTQGKISTSVENTELEELRSKLQKAESSFKKLREQAQTMLNKKTEEIKVLQAEKTTSSEELESLKRKLEETEKEVTELKKVSEESSKSGSAELKEKTDKFRDLQSKFDKTRTELNKANRQLTSAKQEAAAAKQELNKSKGTDTEELNKTIETLRKQLKDTENNNKSTDSSPDVIKKMKEDFAKEKEEAVKAKEMDVRRKLSARITEIAEKRVAERTTQLNEDHKKKLDELQATHKQEMEKLKSELTSSNGKPASDNSSLEKKLKEDFEAEKKKLSESFEMERKNIQKETTVAVRREFEMKERILKMQNEKLKKENSSLKESSGNGNQNKEDAAKPTTIPIRPLSLPFSRPALFQTQNQNQSQSQGTPQTNQASTGSAGLTFNPATAKPFVPANATPGNKDVVTDSNKRSSDDSDSGSAEKRSKTS